MLDEKLAVVKVATRVFQKAVLWEKLMVSKKESLLETLLAVGSVVSKGAWTAESWAVEMAVVRAA